MYIWCFEFSVSCHILLIIRPSDASCFEAVYGNIVEARKSGQILGLCGVCRKDMRLGDLVTGGPASRNVPSMAGRLVRGHSPSGTISAGPDATLGKNTRSS